MSNNITPSTFINGAFAFASYENDGKHRNGARIDEVIVLRTGSLTANQTVTFSLQLGFHFRICSIWADNINAIASDSVTFTLKTAVNTLNNFSVPILGLPYQLPEIALDGTLPYLLDVRPTKTIDNCFIFLRLAYLIDAIELARV